MPVSAFSSTRRMRRSLTSCALRRSRSVATASVNRVISEFTFTISCPISSERWNDGTVRRMPARTPSHFSSSEIPLMGRVMSR